MGPTERDDLSTRLRHLVVVEGYGRGLGLARGVRPSWSSQPVPAIAVCRTTARLRALGPDEAESVLTLTEARGTTIAGTG